MKGYHSTHPKRLHWCLQGKRMYCKLIIKIRTNQDYYKKSVSFSYINSSCIHHAFSLFSMQRLKEKEKAPFNTAKSSTSKEDVMKQKQFGSIEIVITKRKMRLPHTPVKKRKGCQSNSAAGKNTTHNLLAVTYKLLLAVNKC